MSSAPQHSIGDLSTVVLCGGGGRRMGGRDKPLEALNGQPLVAHVLKSLPEGPVVISANRSLTRYREFGWPVISDREISDRGDQDASNNTPELTPRYQGPLAGVIAASEQLMTPWIYVVAGDTPLIPKDLAHELVETCKQENAPAACAWAERAQPLPFVMKRDQLHAMSAYLATGNRSVMGWLQKLKHATLDRTNDAANFVNVNTPAELAALSSP